MAFGKVLCLVVSLALSNVLAQIDTLDIGNATCEAAVDKVDISKNCRRTLTVSSSVEVIISNHRYKVIPNCLNCSFTLTTRTENLLVATLFYLGTETSPSGQCELNKLEIFDGSTVNVSRILSPKSGICGCHFPSSSVYKSSGSTLTLRLQTPCNSSIIHHGELKLLVTTVKNDLFNKTECRGQFKCGSGECVDKNVVCNGHKDCHDGSDETNCTSRNGTCPGQFECKSGQCINKDLVCNGHKDCADRSDEIGCKGHHGNETCPGKFECLHGKCIDKNKVCNGKNDCGDNSDETGCHDRRLLLYILIGVASLIALVFIIILIVLCCKYCCVTWRGVTYSKLS